MEFLSRPEQQARFYRLCGDLPAVKRAWRDSALAADPALRAFEVQLERVAPWPMVPEWEQISIRLQDQAERAVRGGSGYFRLAGFQRTTLSSYSPEVKRSSTKLFRRALTRSHPAAN